MATPFSSILPSSTVDIDATTTTNAASGVNAPSQIQNDIISGASTSADTVPARISTTDSLLIGAHLYATLNILFDSYPTMDELGLIVSMPSSGRGRKGDSASSLSSSDHPIDPALVTFMSAHPPPSALIALQSTQSTPPFLVAESNKLGISFWSVTHLLRFTINKFQQCRSRIRKEKIGGVELTAMARAHLAVVSTTTAAVDATPSTPLHVDLLCCTRILLLINADNYTAWNVRKVLMSAPFVTDSPSVRLLDPLDEIRLLNLIYSKHPKSGESWSHRRWVLTRIDGFTSKYHFAHGGRVSSDATTNVTPPVACHTTSVAAAVVPSSSLYSTPLFQSDLAMCARSADLYPKNYYAWMHRQWLVERIESVSDLQSELEVSSEWTESHINDYSGFVHRQVVWNRMITIMAQAEEESAGAAVSPSRSKASRYARVHHSLPTQLRSWSKKYPSHDAPTIAASASVTAATVAPDAGDVAPVSASPSPPASTTTAAATGASKATAALHTAIGCCSFCSLFSSIEWSHLNELQLKYPGHESLWMHRRFVWHTYIAAINQHAIEAEADAPVASSLSSSSSSVASPSATDAAVSPVIPAWLLPLIRREIAYATFQVDDTQLSNYAANRDFARVYAVWVLHSALSIVYGSLIRSTVDDDGATTGASSNAGGSYPSSFPLFAHLSSSHRDWYISLVNEIHNIQPTLISINHWTQRTQTLTMTTTATV